MSSFLKCSYIDCLQPEQIKCCCVISSRFCAEHHREHFISCESNFEIVDQGNGDLNKIVISEFYYLSEMLIRYITDLSKKVLEASFEDQYLFNYEFSIAEFNSLLNVFEYLTIDKEVFAQQTVGLSEFIQNNTVKGLSYIEELFVFIVNNATSEFLIRTKNSELSSIKNFIDFSSLKKVLSGIFKKSYPVCNHFDITKHFFKSSCEFFKCNQCRDCNCNICFNLQVSPYHDCSQINYNFCLAACIGNIQMYCSNSNCDICKNTLNSGQKICLCSKCKKANLNCVLSKCSHYFCESCFTNTSICETCDRSIKEICQNCSSDQNIKNLACGHYLCNFCNIQECQLCNKPDGEFKKSSKNKISEDNKQFLKKNSYIDCPNCGRFGKFTLLERDFHIGCNYCVQNPYCFDELCLKLNFKYERDTNKCYKCSKNVKHYLVLSCNHFVCETCFNSDLIVSDFICLKCLGEKKLEVKCRKCKKFAVWHKGRSTLDKTCCNISLSNTVKGSCNPF